MSDKVEFKAPDGSMVEINFVSPPEQGPRCETCRFFAQAHEREESGKWRSVPYGQCMRLPPQASTKRLEFALWPKVLSDAWCGEHEPRKAGG